MADRNGKVEDWLRSGCRIRILLIEPSSDAIGVGSWPNSSVDQG